MGWDASGIYAMLALSRAGVHGHVLGALASSVNSFLVPTAPQVQGHEPARMVDGSCWPFPRAELVRALWERMCADPALYEYEGFPKMFLLAARRGMALPLSNDDQGCVQVAQEANRLLILMGMASTSR